MTRYIAPAKLKHGWAFRTPLTTADRVASGLLTAGVLIATYVQIGTSGDGDEWMITAMSLIVLIGSVFAGLQKKDVPRPFPLTVRAKLRAVILPGVIVVACQLLLAFTLNWPWWQIFVTPAVAVVLSTVVVLVRGAGARANLEPANDHAD